MAWLTLAAGVGILLQRRGVPPRAWPEALRAWIAGQGAWGPAAYVLIFAVRPLTFLPAAFLTTASGLIWGPWGGTAFTLVGENISAAVAFWAARWLGREWVDGIEHPLLERFGRRVSRDAFRTVLLLRLIFAPFDVVNFACGLTAMSYRSFAAATLLGIVPGAVCFVLLGSSWRDPRLLLLSGGLLAFCLGGARMFREERVARGRAEPGARAARSRRRGP